MECLFLPAEFLKWAWWRDFVHDECCIVYDEISIFRCVESIRCIGWCVAEPSSRQSYQLGCHSVDEGCSALDVGCSCIGDYRCMPIDCCSVCILNCKWICVASCQLCDTVSVAEDNSELRHSKL